MKLVVLDGYTLNPGDLDWAPLERLGECEIHDRSAAGEVVERSRGAAVVLTNKTPIGAEAIAALPELRYIGVLATGFNVVDIEAASARGIPVTNVPGYGTQSVAQHVFALLLELVSHTGHHARAVRDGRWSSQPDFSFWDFPSVELAGLTLGVIGWGAIGRRVGEIGAAFGMSVVAAASHAGRAGGVRRLELDDLFRTADVISLHCPLTEETRGMVNARRLALMKPEAWLINTGRGQLIVEDDLASALESGRLAGAGLDVLSIEPPPAGHRLLRAPRCLVTPHVAWATRASRARLLDEAAANVRAFLDDRPRNIVNAPH